MSHFERGSTRRRWIYFHIVIIIYNSVLQNVKTSGNSLLVLPFAFPPESSEIGKRVVATCAVSSGGKMDFKWLRNGKSLTKSGNVDIRSYPDLSTLVIDPLTQADSGNYTCVANGHGKVASHTATLEVLVPPSWVQIPRDVDALSGEAIYLDCAGQGIPKPSTTWYKTQGDSSEYMPITYSNHVSKATNGSLLFSSIEKSEEGIYKCNVSNGIGSSLLKTAAVKVIGM